MTLAPVSIRLPLYQPLDYRGAALPVPASCQRIDWRDAPAEELVEMLDALELWTGRAG